MKYKIKFEINYGDLETDELRDCKLDLLNQEITTEIESESPLSIPDKEDSIRLGDEFYKINGKYHQLEKDCYTTTINVTSDKVLRIIDEKSRRREKEMSTRELKNMISSFSF